MNFVKKSRGFYNIKYVVVIGFLLFFPVGYSFGFFPNDAKTIFQNISGIVNVVLVPGTNAKTVLGVSMQQENIASDTYLNCGTTVIARNFAKDLNFVPLNYVCNDTINLSKTGNDTASVIVTYVPYDLNIVPTTTASTTQQFTHGDMVISLFLLMIFFVILLLVVLNVSIGVRPIDRARSYVTE